MTMRAKKLARLSLMTAVSFVLLYLASVIPSGKLALTAIAGLTTALGVIESGLTGGFLVWAAAGAVSLILIPSKDSAILYTVFFGIYPVVKSLIERLGKIWLEWILKLAFFAGMLTVCTLVFREFFAAYATGIFSLLTVVYLLGAAVFVIYDIGFSKLIAYYMSRIANRGKKN